MTNKVKELIIRTASGAVMLLVVVGALMLSKWSAGALFAVIMLGGLVEFYKLCQKRGYKPMCWVGISTSLAIFVGVFSLFIDDVLSDTAFLIAAMCLLYIVVMIPTTFVLELAQEPYAD